MKVFLQPTGPYNRVMSRVANALSLYAPKGVALVQNAQDADVQVLHVTDLDADTSKCKDYAVIQYRGYGERDSKTLQTLWENARMVWSYYPLHDVIPSSTACLYAPLGLDEAFVNPRMSFNRELAIITTGYASGPTTKPIEEIALAVNANKLRMLHIGPSALDGMHVYPACWQAQSEVNDPTLAMLYHNAERVSGLRLGEGFELSALEGMACGARPVVFDRVEMKHWFGSFAEVIPECHGQELVDRLKVLLSHPPDPVKMEERRTVIGDFSWERIATAFWDGLLKTFPKAVPVSMEKSQSKRRLLWIGDAVAATGFARATHQICDVLQEEFEVSVLGINYYGDPHPYSYDIYPSRTGGDQLGYGRVKALVESIGPAIIVVQNDPWNIQGYLERVGNIPVIGFVAVDGKNCKGTELNGLASAVFWTKFAEEEAKRGGYTGPSDVVPLGVDLRVYRPQDRQMTRERMSLPKIFKERGLPEDTFVVGTVGRNQWRKRFDLSIEYFAEWVHSRNIRDAILWMHVAPTGDDAWDLADLAKYYKISDRIFTPVIPRMKGVDEALMSRIYSMFDILLSTTLGEGFGLPMFEAMACGTPLIVPDWSGLGELCENASLKVPCTSTAAHPNQTNTIGGIADKVKTIEALDLMYRNRETRAELSTRGLALVSQPRYRWENIGRAFLEHVNSVLYPSLTLSEEIWADLGRPLDEVEIHAH